MQTLPSTPIQALDISNFTLKLKMHLVVTAAKLFGFWKHPLRSAATSFEEMNLTDIFYWVYKCANPVTRPEKGLSAGKILRTDLEKIQLPPSFVTKNTLAIGAAGDILQAEGLENSQDILFEDIDDILFNQDISYANFESMITTQPLKKEVISDREAPTECCSEDQFAILKGHKGKNFTVLNIANNHTYDMGSEGIETTLKHFAKAGILDVGTNEFPEQYGKGKILVKNGIKIGFVSATFGLNGHNVPQHEAYKINVSPLLPKHGDPNLDLLKKQIDHCKSEGCDFILASLHWGFEFEFFPRMKQIKAARELVEYGADAIISHHPHVIQPVEFYRTQRDPDRLAVIAYSLGSLTWGYTAPHLVLSIILNITLSKGFLDERPKTYISSAKANAVFRSVEITDGKIISRIKRLDKLSGKFDRKHYFVRTKKLADLVLGNAGGGYHGSMSVQKASSKNASG